MIEQPKSKDLFNKSTQISGFDFLGHTDSGLGYIICVSALISACPSSLYFDHFSV